MTVVAYITVCYSVLFYNKTTSCQSEIVKIPHIGALKTNRVTKTPLSCITQIKGSKKYYSYKNKSSLTKICIFLNIVFIDMTNWNVYIFVCGQDNLC